MNNGTVVEANWSACTDDQLEAELCGLAGRVAAWTCQFLLAVAEYDRRQAWENWDCHDMAGWLSWKCGISPVTAREQVRVARALQRFDRLRDHFARGRLSYSQVRAIARVASEQTEAQLVELATVMTAAQLETVTRAYRRSTAADPDTARQADLRRCVNFHWDDDGSLVGSFRLPPEAGALLASAITGVVEQSAIDAAEEERAADPVGAVRADALIDLVTRGAVAPDDHPDRGDDRFLVTIIADAQVLAGGEADGVCQIAGGPGLAAETVRRVTCDAPTVTITEGPDGHILDVGRRTRRINRRLRRALRHRDRHCQYPGCTRTRTHGHHFWHWTKGGPTNLDNLVSLCARHHHRLHEGGYRAQRHPDGQLTFYRPDGRPIPAEPHPSPLPDPAAVPASYAQPYHSDWDGSRLDVGHILDGLLHADGLLDPVIDSAESSATPIDNATLPSDA
jgi:hypothetical protein